MKEKIIEFSKNNPAIILSVLTAYGYFCAYFYALGISFYYNIPNYFIDLQIIDVIKFTASISVITIYILWQLNGIAYNTISITKKSLQRLMFQFNFGCFAMVNTINISIHIPTTFYFYIIGGLIILNIPYYFIIRHRRKEEIKLLTDYSITYADKSEEELIAIMKHERSITKNALTMFLEYLVYWGMFIPFICAFLGYGLETQVKSYITLKQHPHYVIVKKYGENVFCKDLTKNNKLGDSLLILRVSSDKPLDGIIINVNK